MNLTQENLAIMTGKERKVLKGKLARGNSSMNLGRLK